MANDLRLSIKQAAPNIPDEVIDLWLLPFARNLGWPPNHKWYYKLGCEEIAFWNQATWSKETVDLAITPFSAYKYKEQVGGLYRGFRYREVNAFTKGIADFRSRISRALVHTLQHGTFPVPPIILKELTGSYTILDGNHRFAAWDVAKDVYRIYQTLDEEQKQKQLTDLKIQSIVEPDNCQVVWICHPDWTQRTHYL